MPDNLSPEQRKYCMSRIKGKDTEIERLVRSELQKKGFRFRKHLVDLPGKPDVVFTKRKVAVFIDGDFWHGYKFNLWKHKLSPKWQEKISKTRRRDQSNFRKLRRSGWIVLRIWQHQINKDIDECILKIIKALDSRDILQ